MGIATIASPKCVFGHAWQKFLVKMGMKYISYKQGLFSSYGFPVHNPLRIHCTWEKAATAGGGDSTPYSIEQAKGLPCQVSWCRGRYLQPCQLRRCHSRKMVVHWTRAKKYTHKTRPSTRSDCKYGMGIKALKHVTWRQSTNTSSTRQTDASISTYIVSKDSCKECCPPRTGRDRRSI